MNTALSVTSSVTGDAAPGGIKRGRKAKKKRVSLGFRRLSRTALPRGLPGVFLGRRRVKGEVPAAPHRPGEIEQIEDARKFEHPEGDRAHVEKVGQPEDARQEVRDDARRAAQSRGDARPPPAKKSRREGVNGARSGIRTTMSEVSKNSGLSMSARGVNFEHLDFSSRREEEDVLEDGLELPPHRRRSAPPAARRPRRAPGAFSGRSACARPGRRGWCI